MCGRFGLQATWEEMAAMYGLIGGPPEAMRVMPPRYNIAPTQPVLAIRAARAGSGGAAEATFFRWGLVPSWAKDIDIGAHTINARAETVAEKPSFRTAFRRRRCPARPYLKTANPRPRARPSWGAASSCAAAGAWMPTPTMGTAARGRGLT